MSLHQFLLSVEVDDELLAEHEGDKAPPPNDPSEWDGRDLFLAADKGFVDPAETEVMDYTYKSR